MAARTKRDRSNRNLGQYGIFDIPSMNDGENDDDGDGNDSDLEAELLALSSGGGAKPKRPPPKKVAPAVNLDALVASSLRDIPSDEELSGDDDDPDLLNELSAITGDEPEEVKSPSTSEPQSDILPVLQSRLKMYEAAEANATQTGETSRARRLGRGIKTLKDLVKQANAGRSINKDDIPPEVAITVKLKQAPVENPEIQPIRSAPAIPYVDKSEPQSPEQPPSPVKVSATPSDINSSLSPENQELLNLLNNRKDEYKVAALQAKRTGDPTNAMRFIKTAKQFEMVIQAVQNGQPVDLSQMPGPPSLELGRVENETQKQSEPAGEPTQLPEEDTPKPSLITASTVAEALQQRLEVYQNQEQSAKDQGNSSKARRMGRIVKQFEDAIKLSNAGKPIPVEDLPTPPGYGPIPVPAAAKPAEPPKPAPVQRDAEPKPAPSQPKIIKKNSALTRIDKQVASLKARQKEFKDAALNAKKKGELEQAKEYLRTAKGFDPLIQAAEGGFPVDIATLPVPPTAKSQLDEEYEVLLTEEATGEIDPEHLDILSRLEQQLTKQLKMALSTRDHNKAIGDVAGMNRFEHLALSVTRDLDIIRVAKKKVTSRLPKFHYETKNFSIVKSFTDLNDNDLQLTILRGINYNCTNPDSIDTYVKFEFPFPQEEPVRNKSAVIKDTNNPQYDETFTLPIQRSSRPCLRVFKRQSIKFEIYSKGCFASNWACCFSGFFRGDTLLGTVTVKLQPLETQCELHESFDLLDGRKKVGGKLEVRLRVRDPLVTRQIEQLSEKWLVLDH